MENYNQLLNNVNTFISKIAYLWKKGFPNTQAKSYKFKEVEIITNGQLIFKVDLNGRGTAYLDGKYIGSLNIECEDNQIESDMESDIYIEFNSKHKLDKDFIVPSEVSISLYYILLKILKEDPEKAKLNFERLEFEGFYDQ